MKWFFMIVGIAIVAFLTIKVIFLKSSSTFLVVIST